MKVVTVFCDYCGETVKNTEKIYLLNADALKRHDSMFYESLDGKDAPKPKKLEVDACPKCVKAIFEMVKEALHV